MNSSSANDTHSNGPASTNIGVLHSGNHVGKDILLDKIGGKQVLHKAVDDFYDRLVKDPAIEPFFRYANVQVLKWHQYNLMSIAFHNVPVDFDVCTLILEKHKSMFDFGLNEHSYDIVLRHFAETLKDLDVAPEIVDEALALVRPLRVVFEQGAQQAVQRRNALKSRQRAVQLLAVGGSLALCAYVGVKSFQNSSGSDKRTTHSRLAP